MLEYLTPRIRSLLVPTEFLRQLYNHGPNLYYVNPFQKLTRWAGFEIQKAAGIRGLTQTGLYVFCTDPPQVQEASQPGVCYEDAAAVYYVNGSIKVKAGEYMITHEAPILRYLGLPQSDYLLVDEHYRLYRRQGGSIVFLLEEVYDLVQVQDDIYLATNDGLQGYDPELNQLYELT